MPAATPAARSGPDATTADRDSASMFDRRDASMSLLKDVMEHSLDEGYAEAAARRGQRGAATSRRGPTWLLVAGLLAVGLLLSTAAVQTRDRAGSAAQASTALAGEIEQHNKANDQLEQQLDSDRAAVAAARRAALRLTADGKRLEASLAPLETATGATPVTGPALLVHLSDAPRGDDAGADVDPRTDDSSDGRVTDRDLQTIVNEVWAAGAEAIAVNGQRLTSSSAIRSAGDAVLVDFRPLSPPYDVVGIGDARTMRATFAEGFGGSYLQALRGYGIGYTITTKDSVRLEASAGVMLRYAHSTSGTETKP